MSTSTIGSASLAAKITQPDGYDIAISNDGTATATVTYKTSAIGFGLSSMPALGAKHPTISALSLYECSANREAGDIMTVKAVYKGVGISNPKGMAQYEFNATTSSEPIETHPKFSYPPESPAVVPNELAAINNAIENNIEYSALSTFAPAVDPALIGPPAPGKSTQAGRLLYKLKRRGFDSYLNYGGSYRVTYIQSTIPSDYSDVGYAAPTIPNQPSTNRNWLKTAMSWKKQASVISVTEDWQMSGPAFWNPNIYTKPLNPASPQTLTDADKTLAGANA